MELRPSTHSPYAADDLRELPAALPSLALQLRQPQDLVAVHGGQLASCAFQAQHKHGADLLLLGAIPLGELQLICVKTTPLLVQHRDHDRVNVCLSYAGDLVYAADGHHYAAAGGDLLLFPNNGGVLSAGLCSALAFQFEPKRLLRTIAVMLGPEEIPLDLSQAQALPTSRASASGQPGGLLHELIAFIDRLRRENELLPEAMGLEEQCLRSLALELLHANGHLQGLRRRRRHLPKRESLIDELVDFISANLNQPITLTDLEQRSNYSGRQLQYMFRRKFECTPLQFVRRQRLKMAMARLEQCQPADTIAQIAREVGYRSTGSFSADFFRQFGTHPSVVLRSHRRRVAVASTPARPGHDLDRESSSAAMLELSGERANPRR